MKSKFKAIIFTLTMVVFFSVAACGNGQTLNSAEALKEYLDKQPANSPDKPIKVTMAANAPMLEKIVATIMSTDKYVSLNLSGNALTSIPDYAFFDRPTQKGCATLTAITIPNSVTSIGIGAFAFCANLTSITIPSSVTSINTATFFRCSSLASVTIPNSVDSIGLNAFRYCTSLTSITIPNRVTSIGNSAFADCTNLTSITIPSSVTNIEIGAFSGCTSLSSVTMSNGIKSIGEKAFYNCTSLTSVTIPNSVTSIAPVTFGGCTRLTSITIPDSVTNIEEWAFGGCASLASVTIPNSVKDIWANAFNGCTSLANVTIGASVASIGPYVFYDCNSLTSVTFQSTIASRNFDSTPFPGDLRAKYLSGGIGIYTRPNSSSSTWSKQLTNDINAESPSRNSAGSNNRLVNTTYQFKGYYDHDYFEFTFDFGTNNVRFSAAEWGELGIGGVKPGIGTYQVSGDKVKMTFPDGVLDVTLIGNSFEIGNFILRKIN